MPAAESIDPDRPLLDPTDTTGPGNTAEQLGAYLADRVLAGLSAGLAASMAKRTFENGPWLLMGDGRLFAVNMPEPPYGDVLGVLTDHVVDWGRCDHPADCDCSDARARRLLAAHPLVFGEWLDVNETPAPTVTVAHLAALMDDCSGSDGQWNGADVCDALATVIRNGGGWKVCDDHGEYAATKDTCPRCDADESGDQ